MARRPPDATRATSGASELDEALARARRHAKNAVAEALEAGRALLDAASLATSGARAASHPMLARAEHWIRHASRSLADEGGLSGDVGAALAEALQAEIARWEQRARVDDDARAVLRAFLGLRELLWELGIRAAASDNGSEPDADPSGREAEPREDRPGKRPRSEPKASDAQREPSEDRMSPRRVERVPVQG